VYIYICIYIHIDYINVFSKKQLDTTQKTNRLRCIHSQECPKGEEEHTHRHTVKAHVEKDWTGSRLTYAEKEGVERSKEKRNGGRVIEGRGKMERSRVGGGGERMMRERDEARRGGEHMGEGGRWRG